MADTGWLNPGTISTDTSVGTIDWTNTSNALTSDNSYAVTNDFGAASGIIKDSNVKLIIGGTITGTSQASGSDWPSTDTTATYGGATSLWGTTPTVSEVTATNFGVGISAVEYSTTGAISYYLTSTNYGASISSGSTINGIEMRVERYYQTGIACFVAGTMIRGEMGVIAIEDVEVGDRIYSFDQSLGVEIDRVVATLSKEVDRIYHIKAGKTVDATDNHEFLTLEGFKRVDQLEVGVSIYNGEWVQIESIEVEEGKFTVYDLSVQKNHTFIANGFYVHNFIFIGTTTAHIDVVQVKIYYTSPEVDTGFFHILM